MPGNVALAIGNKISYGIFENKTNLERGVSGGELFLTEGNYILANDLSSVLTKEGKLVKQITSNQFKKPTAFVIDTPNNVAYVVDGTRLFKVELK